MGQLGPSLQQLLHPAPGMLVGAVPSQRSHKALAYHSCLPRQVHELLQHLRRLRLASRNSSGDLRQPPLP